MLFVCKYTFKIEPPQKLQKTKKHIFSSFDNVLQKKWFLLNFTLNQS